MATGLSNFVKTTLVKILQSLKVVFSYELSEKRPYL